MHKKKCAAIYFAAHFFYDLSLTEEFQYENVLSLNFPPINLNIGKSPDYSAGSAFFFLNPLYIK